MSVANIKSKDLRCILYVFRLELDDGLVVHKIGITSRTITKRLAEVLMGFFNVYRYSPRATVRRFRAVDNAAELEQLLHKEYAEHGWSPKRKFSGSTELFILDEDVLLARYDELTKVKEEL